MNPVRLFGDPFGDDPAAAALRACLRLLRGNGFDVAWSLSAVQPRPAGPGGRTLALADGVREFHVGTALPPAELDLLQAAALSAVPATAPLLVFAAVAGRADAVLLAALEWPHACRVIAVDRQQPQELLARVRAELHWAGTEDPEIACDAATLRPWLLLPPPDPAGPLLHVGAADPASGSDVAVRVFAARLAGSGRRLRVVLAPDDRATAAALLQCAAAAAAPGFDAARQLEFVFAPLLPEHARDCAAIVQPLRRLDAMAGAATGGGAGLGEQLVQLLASGRPVAATRFAATAPLLGPAGAAMPFGGHWLPPQNGAPACCEPEPRSVAHALQRLLDDPALGAATGRRARAHVLTELTTDRPASPPVPAVARASRPVVVLEAPWFELSSSSILSIATAQALQRRGRVELRLSPTRPNVGTPAALAARAPDLVPLLARDPGAVDLWLSTGWPPRAARPRCGTFALRFDWEYGALPLDLCPLVPQEADLVVVHSAHVQRTVAAAGRPASRTAVVPHGIDGAVFHDAAAPLAEVVAWKASRPAVLFAGGLLLRKGFDVFLRAALAAAGSGHRFALVVKTVGHQQHYRGFHLGELARRFQATAGAPPLLLIERDLDAAEMAGLYRACDLLLHPYRGEGFGLPVLEARACGLPVIVTGGGATDDFAFGPGVVQLPSRRQPVDLPAPHLAQPWWLEPDAEEACVQLGLALQHLGELQAAARAAAPAVRLAGSWDAAAAAIEQLALDATGERPAGGADRERVGRPGVASSPPVARCDTAPR